MNKKRKNQLKKVKDAFYENLLTMKMVEENTGVMRENICRYVSMLKKSNEIYLVCHGICPITKFSSVGFYTTNPDLIPENNQLNLFS